MVLRNTPPGGGAVNKNVQPETPPVCRNLSESVQYQSPSSGGAPIQGITRCSWLCPFDWHQGASVDKCLSGRTVYLENVAT